MRQAVLEPPEPRPPPDARASVWLPRAGLFVVLLLFVAYAAQAVPRLTNNLVGDSEFTGWTGPIAERFFNGATPYSDFVLPIPPGPFAVMALIQTLSGRAVLLQELWLIAGSQLAMTLAAYAIARAFFGRLTGLLVAACSLATVLQLYKECAYDHTAQVLAWASIAAGAHALTRRNPSRGLWLAAGTLAALTLSFKQSTGSGIALGWALAFFYLAFIAFRSGGRTALLSLKIPAASFAAGILFGLALDLLLILGTGSSPTGFLHAAYVDGAALKGGSSKLLFNLFSYLWRFEAWPASLGVTLVAAWIVRRSFARSGSFDLASPDAPDPPRVILASLLVVTLAFGAAALLLWTNAAPLPAALLTWSERAKMLPSMGLCALVVLVVTRFPTQREAAADASRQRDHALIAVSIAALVCSLLHNLSFPGFRPFYDNNPIIVVAFLLMFAALERAQLKWAKPLVLALSLCVLFGHKLSRHLEATQPVSEGHWAGIRVNPRGQVVVAAAERARALAGPAGTVLVLPEDVALARLIGSPRPPLRGAIVFVDQYPAQVLASDLALLERAPPQVVVVHPSDAVQWKQMYALWSTSSPAQKLAEKFLNEWLPRNCSLDSSYPTRFGRKQGKLEIWVLRK